MISKFIWMTTEDLVFSKISHFTNFARILVFTPYKTIGQLYSSLYTMVSLLGQSVSQILVICEILHFRKFNRKFVYFPWIENLILRPLITFTGISMTPAFLKEDSINSPPKKLVFCKISHFTTFRK